MVKGIRFTFILAIGALVCVAANAQDLLVDANTTLVEGTYDYDNVQVTNNATLTVEGMVTINTTTFTVDAGASVSGKGEGYTWEQGPGAGVHDGDQGSGGGHGGVGGSTSKTIAGEGGVVNDSGLVPVDMGSGGGGANGGAGGGALTLNVSGVFTNNGIIDVSGNNALGTDGGGAGGAIYIIAATVDGNGVLQADGGNAGTLLNGGGGAGGRIAIYYNTSTWTGTATTAGGLGNNLGSPGATGTIAFIDNATPAALVLNAGATWRFEESEADNYDFATINLLNTTVVFETDVATPTINVGEASVTALSGVTVAPATLTVNTNAVMDFAPDAVLDADDFVVAGDFTWQGDLSLDVTDLTVAAASSISADGKGYALEEGPGAGGYSTVGSGGGHGGAGGVSGGASYGSALMPETEGSGGGGATGGAGGGAIQLNVSGTLTVDGLISAKGTAATDDCGGGAGGSIYITAGTFAGSGTLDAAGGAAGDTGATGGGAGGRIAVTYETSTFTGMASAAGGASTGGEVGEAGTVGFFDVTDPVKPDFIAGPTWTFEAIDGYQEYTNVTLDDSVTSFETYIVADAIGVVNGTVSVAEAIRLDAALLTLGAGADVVCAYSADVSLGDMVMTGAANWTGNLDVSVANLTIDAGASLNANATGFQAGTGYEPGGTDGDNGAGGGYGGAGGAAATAIGGGTYASSLEPTAPGSGGGGPEGGAGGGAVRLDVANTLTVDGTLSSNGAAGGNKIGRAHV